MTANKRQLRVYYKNVRHKLPDKNEKSFAIQKTLLPMLDKYQTIALYASMDDEVSLDALINELLSKNKTILLPKVNAEEISFYRINSLDELSTNNKFSIREPITNEAFVDYIDVAVVPGICFDLLKNRIGFGKAFYDKFFAKHPHIYKIGVCFDEQVTDKIVVDKDDIHMDIIITDKRIIA